MSKQTHDELDEALGRLEMAVSECRSLVRDGARLCSRHSSEWRNAVDQWEALVDVLRYDLEAAGVDGCHRANQR